MTKVSIKASQIRSGRFAVLALALKLALRKSPAPQTVECHEEGDDLVIAFGDSRPPGQ